MMKSTSGWKQSSRTRVANWLAAVAWHVIPKKKKSYAPQPGTVLSGLAGRKREKKSQKGVFRNLLRAAIDHSVLIKGTREEVQNYVKFEGKEEFLKLTQEHPVIVVTPPLCRLRPGRNRHQYVLSRLLSLSAAVQSALG